VNFLAAVILYVLAVGNVRGFAFTLGLTTLIDLVVVALFTHPLVLLLSKLRFFREGHPASGLSPERLGVSQSSAWIREVNAKDRQTLAEKKAGISLDDAPKEDSNPKKTEKKDAKTPKKKGGK
jgi:preprotein translocase subunit SecD